MHWFSAPLSVGGVWRNSPDRARFWLFIGGRMNEVYQDSIRNKSWYYEVLDNIINERRPCGTSEQKLLLGAGLTDLGEIRLETRFFYG